MKNIILSIFVIGFMFFNTNTKVYAADDSIKEMYIAGCMKEDGVYLTGYLYKFYLSCMEGMKEDGVYLDDDTFCVCTYNKLVKKFGKTGLIEKMELLDHIDDTDEIPEEFFDIVMQCSLISFD